MKKSLSLFLAVVMSISIFMFTPTEVKAASIHGAGRVKTENTALNIRSSASTSSAIKGKLKNNTYVTLISKKKNFWYVQYGKSNYGYCHTDYIKTISEDVKTVRTSSGRLRVRGAASTSAKIKDYLTSGTTVTVISAKNGFSRIVYNGTKTGYVGSEYLTSATNENTYKAIRLNVPDFKQTDSRWANVTLGNSGQTIGKIGCATTAIAMLESYRTDTTIYPHTMAKRLSYTSGGAVYWPSHYNIVTSSSGYLSKIHSLLKAGKPVLLGAKKANGSQHYVVVTGIKATNSLNTSAFYINDPGSSTRKTLNQFLSDYPYFYKMMSY